jgi:GTP pyrophosphokinase
MTSNDGQASLVNSFPARVGRAFDRADSAMVLSAHACASERSEGDAEFQRHAADHRVADILLDQRADAVVVTAALLTPPHQRGELTTHEITSLFGDQVADLVVRASVEPLSPVGAESHRTEDPRRWLRSMSADIRTVVLRVGLRLGAVEKLAESAEDDGGDDDQEDVAQETLDLYVPLADRMGMGALRTRLEDACFRLLQPTIYAEVARSIEPIREADQICLSLLKDGVAQLLDERGIEATVQGRTKGLYSIYRKMHRLDSSLEEVMDRVGLRVIVPSVEACYEVLGLLHTRFRPVPGTFDDYIGFPKANGYQSLHTCVYPVPDISAKPVEFQIRTEAMHREAEYGVAAHWLYKDHAWAAAENERQLERLRRLLPSDEDPPGHAEFIERLHRQVDDDRLVVFLRKERAIRLPAGATVGDLVRHLGADDNGEIKIEVNGRVHPLECPLRDGDAVDVGLLGPYRARN